MVSAWILTTPVTTRPERRTKGIHKQSYDSSCSVQRHWMLYATEKSGENNVVPSSNMDTTSTETNTALLATLLPELREYLAIRKASPPKPSTSTTIGGTKGNKILEFVSIVPSPETVLENGNDDDSNHALNYDQLAQYGYSHLATPIMQAGGRYTVSRALGIEPPVAPPPKDVVVASSPLINSTTNSDVSATSNYPGLQLGLLLDDAAQAQALEQARQQQSEQKSTVPDAIQNYRQPFADKRNVGPRQTPDWTPERIDAWAQQQGRVQAWARAAREGAYVQDPAEQWDALNGWQRGYSIVTAVCTAVAWGRSTGALLEMEGDAAVVAAAVSVLLPILRVLASGLLVGSLGSAVFASQQAMEKNRNGAVWAVKGWLGGPFTLREMGNLRSLLTQKETDDEDEE